MARHAQSTQNNEFANTLQYLKKEVRGEVILQIETMTFNGDGQAFPEFTK